MPKRHTYLRTHTLSSPVLSFHLGAEDAALRARANEARSGRAAKTLVKEGRMRVTLMSMRRGALLSAHQVEGVVSLHALRGRALVSAEGQNIELSPGEVLMLQEEVPHAAKAISDCALLVTVAMSGGA
jgi:quercetin dioxygenase-like cupin family protein